jgi:hypothetical protein
MVQELQQAITETLYLGQLTERQILAAENIQMQNPYDGGAFYAKLPQKFSINGYGVFKKQRWFCQ